MKKRQKDIAIDYFTVATELSKKEEKSYDFTDLIAKLKGTIDKKNKKPRFTMKVEDFNNNDNYYGIENFDEITSYILESKLDVETACQKLNISNEEIDIIRLIYARKFYSQGSYDKGDQFLKSVEQSKNKSEFTIKLIEEIRKNKKFYINRSNENEKILALTLKPKK